MEGRLADGRKVAGAGRGEGRERKEEVKEERSLEEG